MFLGKRGEKQTLYTRMGTTGESYCDRKVFCWYHICIWHTSLLILPLFFYGSVQVFLDISCTYFIASRVPD